MAFFSKFGLIARNFHIFSPKMLMTKLPVEVHGLNGKYAAAVFSAAIKMDQLNQVEDNLYCLRYTLNNHPHIFDLLKSPIISRKKMGEALQLAVKDLEWSPTTGNFLEVIAENGRLRRIHGIIKSFLKIMQAYRRDVICHIETAKPLTNDQTETIENTLRKFIKRDQEITLECSVDPDLIGGMTVTIDDKFIDLSIAKKVNMYKKLISIPVDDDDNLLNKIKKKK